MLCCSLLESSPYGPVTIPQPPIPTHSFPVPSSIGIAGPAQPFYGYRNLDFASSLPPVTASYEGRNDPPSQYQLPLWPDASQPSLTGAGLSAYPLFPEPETPAAMSLLPHITGPPPAQSTLEFIDGWPLAPSSAMIGSPFVPPVSPAADVNGGTRLTLVPHISSRQSLDYHGSQTRLPHLRPILPKPPAPPYSFSIPLNGPPRRVTTRPRRTHGRPIPQESYGAGESSTRNTHPPTQHSAQQLVSNKEFEFVFEMPSNGSAVQDIAAPVAGSSTPHTSASRSTKLQKQFAKSK